MKKRMNIPPLAGEARRGVSKIQKNKNCFMPLLSSPCKRGNTRKFVFIIIAFFLTACSSTLPNKSREISDYIPQEKIIEEIPANFDYAVENFPEECRWEKLKLIIDGDTIHTEKSKVRLIGVDTPEVKSPFTEDQPGGKEATIKIRELLENSDKVCLIHDKIGDKIDKYGRSLDYIFTENGTDINAEMIKTGFARWYSQFPYERKGEFKIYQDSAKEKDLGLWE